MARSTPKESPGRILRATQSFTHDWNGAPTQFNPYVTVREGHPVLKGIEHLFEPLTPDYEVQPDFETEQPRGERPEFEQATAAPNEKRGDK